MSGASSRVSGWLSRTTTWCTLVVACSLSMLAGCQRSSEADVKLSPFRLELQCAERPLEAVHVTLYRGSPGAWAPVLEGTSDAMGRVALHWIPMAESFAVGEVTSLRAACESLGSGDWFIRAKWSNPETSALEVTFTEEGGSRGRVQIPTAALAPL